MYDKEHKDYLRKLRFNKFLVHLVQLLIIILFLFLWNHIDKIFVTYCNKNSCVFRINT